MRVKGQPWCLWSHVGVAALMCACSGTGTGPGDTTPDAAPSTLADAAVDMDASVRMRPDAARVDASANQDAALPTCSPALALTPSDASVLLLDLLTLHPSGGTGAYVFSLSTNASGAIISPLTGAYLSGERTGVADVVELKDNGCIGSVTATIHVVAPMTVFPTQVELPPGGQFTLEVHDGLGPFTYSMVMNSAGGMLSSSGHYSVQTTTGRDVLRVTDEGSGQFVETVVDVVTGAVLRPAQGALFIPVGSSITPSIQGGSGRVNATVQGSAITAASNGVLTAVSAGNTTVALVDAFTGQTASITVVGMASQGAQSIRVGDQTGISTAWAPGDVDGDGFADALLGVPESDITGIQSGGLYLYRGSANGLLPTPARVWGGVARRDELGRAVATADFNGDGLVDLAVGAYLEDVGQTDNGALHIHFGVAGQIWPQEPDLVLSGRFGGDQFGIALAACDFNGDGFVDLAAGAPLAEDRSLNPQFANQGSVAIFLGYATGFFVTPDMTLYGQLPAGDGGWAGAPELRLGNALAAGDMDGDGKCDLAVGGLNYKVPATNRSNDGFVGVYKGTGAAGPLPGGVLTQPSLAWAGISDVDPSSQFGRFLAMGDVDGDGKADLVAAQTNHDKDAGVDQNWGAVRVFAGRALPATPPSSLLGPEAADWTWDGIQNGDNAGWWVTAQDVDGDGKLDVLSGNLRGESPTPDAGLTPDGGRIDAGPPPAANAGSVTAFKGSTGALPASTVLKTWGGLTAEDRFGQSVTALGDLDGDSIPDLLAFAGRADLYGLDVGVPYFVPGDVTRPLVPLEFPGSGAGSLVGKEADIVGDVDGDGLEDLLVGAAQSDPMAGINAGVAYLYKGTSTGFETTAAVTLSGFTGHGASDFVGWAVSRAGDFDGDGVADFAVVARNEDRPATFAAATYGTPPMECVGARNDSGAVYIFKGKANGLPENKPAFMWFGPQAGQLIETIAGGFDFNGDGLGDLVVGSTAWDNGMTSNVGGVAIISGRAAPVDGTINIICDTLVGPVLGLAANDNLGRSVAWAGDINQDGCADVAVGANAEDLGKTDQGSVRVLLGFGKMGCPAAAMQVLLVPDVASAQAGFSLAGGADVDGDSVPDLAVGGVGFKVGANTPGTAWIIPGAYIASLTPEAVTVPAPTPHTFADPARSGTFRVDGLVTGERFGAAVALLPGASGGNKAGLAVGGPQGQLAGPQFTGGVRVFSFLSTGPAESQGLQAVPVVTVAGETTRAGSRMGESLRAGKRGSKNVLLVGAFESSAVGLDEGALYVVVMP